MVPTGILIFYNFCYFVFVLVGLWLCTNLADFIQYYTSVKKKKEFVTWDSASCLRKDDVRD